MTKNEFTKLLAMYGHAEILEALRDNYQEMSKSADKVLRSSLSIEKNHEQMLIDESESFSSFAKDLEKQIRWFIARSI